MNPAEANSLSDKETEDEKIASILDLNCVRHFLAYLLASLFVLIMIGTYTNRQFRR
jgi:hypothetical protein